MPYTTAMQQTYDSGDFVEEPRRLPGARRLRRGRRAAGGGATSAASCWASASRPTVAATGGRDYEHAEIRFDPSGGVVLMTGSMDHGQGHGTTFKQVLSEKLGIDADLIRYRYGDSDLVTMGIGTFGSRSAQLAGSAIVVAADRLIDKGQADRRAHDGGGERRHRLRERPVYDRRHRPLGRRSTRSRAEPFHVGASAERHRDRLYRAGEFRSGRTRRPFRAARISARSRSTTRPAQVALTRYCRGRRCRTSAEPAAVRGTDPRRHRPGDRPGADGGPGLRSRERAAADRLVPGLLRCRAPTISAISSCAKNPTPTEPQPARRQGRRRGRHARRDPGGDERGQRRAGPDRRRRRLHPQRLPKKYGAPSLWHEAVPATGKFLPEDFR